MKGTLDWQKNVIDWPQKLPELEIDVLKTALLIVDMQNSSDLPLKVLPNNIKLRDFFQQQGLKVVYLRVGQQLPDGRDYHIKRQLTWLRASATAPPTLCPKGSPTYEIREELKPSASELVIDKNTGSAFNSSSIDYHLWAMGIQNLVICGIATARCVENTARDAADKGYNVILVEDACGDRIVDNHQATMHTFARVLGAVKTTSEIIDNLSQLIGKADFHRKTPQRIYT